jgi:hypothetical protein
LAPVIGSPDSLARRHLRRVCRVSGPPLAPVRLVCGSLGETGLFMPIRIGDGIMHLARAHRAATGDEISDDAYRMEPLELLGGWDFNFDDQREIKQRLPQLTALCCVARMGLDLLLSWSCMTSPPCISSLMKVTGSARAGSPRSGGWSRRSPSACSLARYASYLFGPGVPGRQ